MTPPTSIGASKLTRSFRRRVAPRIVLAVNRPAASTPSPRPAQLRPFSQTSFLHAKKDKGKKGKKGKKSAAEEEEEEEDDDDAEEQVQSTGKKSRGDKSTTPPAPASDFDHEAAFDLADVETKYKEVSERFEKRLQELKVGRFNPEVLGQLKVQPDRNAPETYPLSDFASVVPRGGRNLSIIVSDATYIKPVMSAVQNSKHFNQQPQQDPDNDLELILRIEADDPEEQVKRVKAAFNAWKDAAREALAERKVKHAKWLKAKDITKDELKLLDKKTKALQDKEFEAIDTKEKKHQAEMAKRSKRL